MKEGIRTKIAKREQKNLFMKLKENIGSRKKTANFLRIKEGTYKGYRRTKVKYLPKEVIDKICHKLNIKPPKILDAKTLKEIRQSTIKKTYPALRDKYGKDWQKKRGYIDM